MLSQEFCSSPGISTILFNEMAHRLPGLFPSWLSGVSRDKPNLSHFRGPLSVMIPFSWRLSKIMLPQMGHFMGKVLKTPLVAFWSQNATGSEQFHRLYLAGWTYSQAAHHRTCVPRHGYKAGWQRPG